jgi:hypothetical protein
MVNKEQLEYVSPYSAGSSSSDDMTTGQFEYYLTQASLLFTQMDTGVSSTTATHCRLLLVAHYYECSMGRTIFQSEGIGDYSYSRITDSPMTAYLQQVLALVSGLGASPYADELSYGATRNDADNLSYFKLDAEDQRDYPTL